MMCGLLGFPSGELGPAVISSHRFFNQEITMKTLILAAIRCSLMFAAVTSLFPVRPAQAYTVTLERVGSNVVATGSGPIDLTGLNFFDHISINAGVLIPVNALITTGPTSSFVGV